MATTPQIDKVYLREHGRLRRLLTRLTGNRATAEDLVQEAFVRVLSGRQQDEIQSYEAYLTRVARNLALNHLRRLRMGIEVSVETEVIQALADDQPSAEMAIIARQSLEQILRAIVALPPRRREVFILHRFDHLTYDQIAARLHISRNTVMVQIVNALADLRRAMLEAEAAAPDDETSAAE